MARIRQPKVEKAILETCENYSLLVEDVVLGDDNHFLIEFSHDYDLNPYEDPVYTYASLHKDLEELLGYDIDFEQGGSNYIVFSLEI